MDVEGCQLINDDRMFEQVVSGSRVHSNTTLFYAEKRLDRTALRCVFVSRDGGVSSMNDQTD